ncbi:MAG: zinc chelation protein SecC [Porticoccaceae bacterium]|nr:zinc chelation protein SecC [Porticoccaceae bacterium]
MRSRYSAYTRGNEEYLLRTWHSSTRPAQLNLDNQQSWQRLKILATTAGQVADDSGEVEFVAIYKVNGRAERLHERSRFCREDQQWRYIDGNVDDINAN